jgi:UDP-N-acetylglucosamine 2-epimerase (non-hydrolysing)
MKVLTVLGTRPEIIRLSRVIDKLDRFCSHILVHTGQNFDPDLSDVFFQQLKVRLPNYYLGVKGKTFGQQVGRMLEAVDKIFNDEHPDALLILGDTNSGLCSFTAKRMGIPVYHMEAGNRCYDDRVPEEVNRRVIDHSSTVLMPYTQRSRENLLSEGISNNHIYVIGNPIFEVINFYDNNINASDVHARLGIRPGKFFLVTMHRAENVDIEYRLKNLVDALTQVQHKYNYPVICSLHPRTKDKLQQYGIDLNNDQVRLLSPLGFFDFVALERTAFCVLSDSGTVQEECCIFHVPNVTIRDVTERPETIECGSNILSGIESKTILRCMEIVLSRPPNWEVPVEYLEKNASSKVVKIMLGFHNYA